MNGAFATMAVPFRMQPGLVRLAPDAHHLTPLHPASALFAEKQKVSHAAQAVQCVPGFDATDALACIARHAVFCGCPNPSAPGATLELCVEEDLAVLDTKTGTMPWMCVCVPSGWAPEEKIGMALASIHAPVADNQALQAAWPRLQALLAQGGHWERHVWTVSPSPCYDQHPHRRRPSDWPATEAPDDFAMRCYLRTERQSFFPVVGTHGEQTTQVVFTIRVMLEPLHEAVATPAHAQRLHDALHSMTASVLAYKRLTTARAPLLVWLAARANTA